MTRSVESSAIKKIGRKDLVMLHKNKNKKMAGTMAITRSILVSLLIAGFGLSGPLAAQEAPGGDDGYLIGPGDTLNVFVWRQEELSSQVPVRPDGRISTPLVEDMPAVGKTPTQLATDIEEVLSEYIRSPQVTIIVEQFVGTFNAQIRVLGQAVNPGAVPYRDRMTLLDVLIEAGGLTEFAAGNRSKLLRTVDGEQTETRVKLDRLVNRGDLSENRPVQPGDVIVIPEAIF
jgi:polysaccharide export outer membrane protein